MIMTWFDVERGGKATTTLRCGQPVPRHKKIAEVAYRPNQETKYPAISVMLPPAKGLKTLSSGQLTE
jgi:hypothetical protein